MRAALQTVLAQLQAAGHVTLPHERRNLTPCAKARWLPSKTHYDGTWRPGTAKPYLIPADIAAGVALQKSPGQFSGLGRQSQRSYRNSQQWVDDLDSLPP